VRQRPPLGSKEWDQIDGTTEVRWFVGSKTNVSYSCLDCQIEQGQGDKAALIWEVSRKHEDPTYEQAHRSRGEDS